MNVECPKCNRKYEVEDAYIPIGGAPIRCPNCGNIFGIYVEPIDIPMTPIIEETPPKPASKPTPPQMTPPVAETPAQQPINPPVQEPAPTILGNTFEEPSPPTPESPSIAPELGALGNLGQEPQTETTPELENIDNKNINSSPATNPQTHEPVSSDISSDLGGFGNIQPAENNNNVPADLGDIMSQPDISSQAETASQDSTAFGNIPLEETPSPDLGAMLGSTGADPVAEQPSADLGGFGNIQPEAPIPPTPEPTMPNNETPAASPDLDNIAPIPSSPEISPASPDIGTPTPIETPEPIPVETKKAKKKLGGNLFESLLAGFTLPDNFKNMSPNVQKNHKSSIKLARQLAKDILLYHKEDVERGLGSGNLKNVLKDEVEKSFKFYQQRVEPEILQNSNYFTEALNKIIGKGQTIF